MNEVDPFSTNGRAPILVLGLGNLLLSDEGLGLTLLEQLQRSRDWGQGVEFVDGGTRGIGLLPYLENRRALLILDAMNLGGEPGTVHVVEGRDNFLHTASAPKTAHEGNALQLIQSAYLIGIAPEQIAVVGIAPATLETNIGLSGTVQAALPDALRNAESLLLNFLRTS